MGYLVSRPCYGATLPVRFVNCQGGSARIVPHFSPEHSSAKDSAADFSDSLAFGFFAERFLDAVFRDDGMLNGRPLLNSDLVAAMNDEAWSLDAN